MIRLRPHITGIALGLGLAAWGGLRTANRPLLQGVRWIFVGVGAGCLMTHTLERWDESADARRRDRKARLKLMERQISLTHRLSKRHGKAEEEKQDSWLEAALQAETHFNAEVFEEQVAADGGNVRLSINEVTDHPKAPSPPQNVTEEPVDPRLAFDSAMAEGKWQEAVEAYSQLVDSGGVAEIEPAVVNRLRTASLESIFQRMHSGSVREDVAALAQSIVQTFPETKEGRTLAPVMGVLRRSAGLCPRCARPYKGIANACHECLHGTPEAYQIAWDEEVGPGNGKA